MKFLFVILGAALALAGLGTYLSYPNVQSDVPVLYWVTDPNPARREQIDLFHQWLVDQGLTDERGEPMMELRLDTNNTGMTKVLIQGVSGVGSDIVDIHANASMHFLERVGMLADVTEPAQRLGFSPAQTYATVEPMITVDGRQYTFPCNVFVRMQWVNEATFAQHDQPLPPRRWSFDEFERMGRQFVAAANEGRSRRTVFYTDDVKLTVMFRSLGLSVFNETLTRCTLDDERFAAALRRKYQWIHEDHILPSAAQRDSFATEAGYGGAKFQLFASDDPDADQYAMMRSGRYALIQLRQFGEMALTVVEPPHGGFPNAESGTRAAAVYAAGEHPELAHYFLAYLASEPYNMQIVRDGDALPPNPRYTETEAFRKPAAHPNEWGVHERFAKAIDEVGIGRVHSPFVLDSIVQRALQRAEENVMNQRSAPEAAGRAVASEINDEIQRTLAEQPDLKQRHERLRADQRRIERLRAAGEPVPAELIRNPFHQRYYRARGWLVEADQKEEAR
ncbi:MAG: ABC transporter substrate-binding protein [Phycisphaeraceae bacterium]